MIEAYNHFSTPLEVTLEDGTKVMAYPLHLLISSNDLNKDELEKQLAKYGLKSCQAIGSTMEMRNWLPTAAYAIQLGEKFLNTFFFSQKE
jgi:hypothetical protein